MTPSTLNDTQARAELARLMGAGLVPQAGCLLTQRSLGDATVIVEYERTPGERQFFDPINGVGHPGADADITILNVLINGVMCDAEDVVAPTVLERWRDELLSWLHEELA